MRSVLIAAASVLLATPVAGQTVEEKGMDRVTTCEVYAKVYASDFSAVDSVRILRGGLEPDITIEGVEPFFDPWGPDGISLCEALAEKEAPKICKKNNRKGRSAPFYEVGFSFKKLEQELAPLPTCTGPTDPLCLDSLFDSFKMTTFDSSVATGNCSDLLSE